MGYFNSRDSSTQSLQNISTSSTGNIGVNIGIVNFGILFFALFITSDGIWFIAFIPLVLAIIGTGYGIKGLREKPTSKFSIVSIILGIAQLFFSIYILVYTLLWGIAGGAQIL